MHVLLVDDDEDICMILEMLFKKKGWDVKTCTSGQAALEMVDKIEFDVLFLDILMPDMDGVELLKKIREIPKLSQVPVIFLTAKDLSQAERAELFGMGAQGIYHKPMDPIDIIESASQYMKK